MEFQRKVKAGWHENIKTKKSRTKYLYKYKYCTDYGLPVHPTVWLPQQTNSRKPAFGLTAFSPAGTFRQKNYRMCISKHTPLCAAFPIEKISPSYRSFRPKKFPASGLLSCWDGTEKVMKNFTVVKIKILQITIKKLRSTWQYKYLET